MYADALASLLAALLLVVLFYGPWQSVCTDWARQTIFESRDRLFDMAREGRLSFESDEYRTIRSSLESLIRYAHQLTIVRFAWMLSMRETPLKRSNMDTAISKIYDQDTRNEVRGLTDRACRAIIWMMGAKSLLGIMVMIAAPFKPVRRIAVTIAKTHVDEIQKEAEIGAC